jgi:hypothetical protein
MPKVTVIEITYGQSTELEKLRNTPREWYERLSDITEVPPDYLMNMMRDVKLLELTRQNFSNTFELAKTKKHGSDIVILLKGYRLVHNGNKKIFRPLKHEDSGRILAIQ